MVKNKGDNISFRDAPELPLLDFGPFGLTAKADASGVDLKVGRGWGRPLLHRIRAESLQRKALGDILFELDLGAEDDAVTLDVVRGAELLVGHSLTGVALALDADVERAQVVEHHATACEQGLGDEGFDTCQHGHDVTFGTGGGEGDIFGKVIEAIVGVLHCGAFEIIHFGILGVGTFDYFVGNCHVV